MGDTPQILQGIGLGDDQAPQPTGFNGPHGNTYDSGVARIPAPQVPMAPAGQQDVGAAPDIGTGFAPGSLADKISAAYLEHLTKHVDAAMPPPPDRSTAQRVGAGLSALGAGLGDMRTGPEGPGHGWLGAVGATLNARTQRLDAEQQVKFNQAEEKRKNDALLARSQAETVALHRNFYQQDEEHRQQFHEGNAKFFSPYRESNDIEDDVNQEELYNRMKKDPNFAQNYLARATGEVPVVDGNGNEVLDTATGLPVMKPVYSVMKIATKDGSPATATVDAGKAADYAKYAGTSLPVGTKLTVLQDNMLNNRMAGVRDAASILGKANGKALDNDQLAALRPALSDPHVQFVLAHVPGDAVASINNGMSDADAMIQQNQQILQQAQAATAKGVQPTPEQQQAVAKAQSDIASLQDLKTKLTQIQNQGLNDHATDDYDKRHGDINNRLLEMEKGVSTIKSEPEAAAMAAETGNMMNQRGLTVEQRQRVQQINQQAKSAQAAMSNVKKTDAALAEGDTDVLVDAALNYQLDPNKLYSMRKNTNAEFKAKMLAKDPTWSEATYKQRYAMNQSLADDKPNSMGGQVDSLNRFALHTGAANRGIQGLRNINSPILNTPLNKIKSDMVGFEEAQAFKIEAETAKDEYLNFIKNGHVPPTEQEERLAASISPDRTPAELQATFRAMAGLVAARAHSMNGRYATIMGGGKNIPGLLQPDTENVLRQFGVDVPAITNTTGTTSFSSPINPVKLPPNVPQGSVLMQAPGGKPHWIAPQNIDAARKAGASEVK